ncbi:MAG: hypothetical protein U1E03_07120 [Hyphomonadaceae bacterium]
MRVRVALMALALIVAGCDRQAATNEQDANAPTLDAPAPETEPSRSFAAANDSATSATGQLTVSVAMRWPDANQSNADPSEVLTLTGANGVIVEAELTGAVSPATQVAGQTVRALLNIPVEEPQVLVYRVTNETRPNTQGICGADAATNVVVWEPSGPGDPVMKVLGTAGGAPGAAGARPCAMLEYRRS